METKILKYFFFNTIKDEKEFRRAKNIKNKFKKILNNWLFIDLNRKKNILEFFSRTRKPLNAFKLIYLLMIKYFH